MKNPKQVTCKINLLDGEPISFKIEATAEKVRNVGSRIEKFMNSNYIGVRLPERLLLVPMQNVQSIELSPAPDGLIMNVVNDAIPLDDPGTAAEG